MLLYYITDRTQLPGDEPARRAALLQRIARAARAGVDYIQLRERDLPARELEQVTRQAADAVRAAASATRLLLNSRADIAIAVGAHGVHLRADDPSASDARAIFHKAGVADALIAVSCHTVEELSLAESHGADFAVFGPIFEGHAGPAVPGRAGKRSAPVGLPALRAACRRKHAASPPMPLLALGGVTAANARACLRAGAAGIAGIRLFQEGDLEETVDALRALAPAE